MSFVFIPSKILFKKNDLKGGVLTFRLIPSTGEISTVLGDISAFASNKLSLSRFNGLVSMASAKSVCPFSLEKVSGMSLLAIVKFSSFRGVEIFVVWEV